MHARPVPSPDELRGPQRSSIMIAQTACRAPVPGRDAGASPPPQLTQRRVQLIEADADLPLTALYVKLRNAADCGCSAGASPHPLSSTTDQILGRALALHDWNC